MTGVININAGVLTCTGTGSAGCTSDGVSTTAKINFDGTNYIEWPDNANWGDLGGLNTSGNDYSFGFVLGDEWPDDTTPYALFSRGDETGFAVRNRSIAAIFGQRLYWIGLNNIEEEAGFTDSRNFGLPDGLAIQFNFSAENNQCDIYTDGNLRHIVNLPILDTSPQTTGIVRFGKPPTDASSWGNFQGKLKCMWFANGHRFSGGTVSADQATNPDITDKSYYTDNTITSFFNLGTDIYPYVTDKKGNVTTGQLINGSLSDFEHN